MSTFLFKPTFHGFYLVVKIHWSWMFGFEELNWEKILLVAGQIFRKKPPTLLRSTFLFTATEIWTILNFWVLYDSLKYMENCRVVFFPYFLSVTMQLLMHFKGHNFSLFNMCVNQTGGLHSSKLSVIAMPCTVSTKKLWKCNLYLK